MRKMIPVIAMLGISAMVPGSSASAAYVGFCFEPRAPIAILSKPTKPYCAVSRSCDKWQVDNYRSSVERYYSDLESYASDVDRYYKKAAEYIECMSDLS